MFKKKSRTATELGFYLKNMDVHRSAGKMPEQVAFALKQIFMQQGGLDAEQAENYFSAMSKTGQYQEECWS